MARPSIEYSIDYLVKLSKSMVTSFIRGKIVINYRISRISHSCFYVPSPPSFKHLLKFTSPLLDVEETRLLFYPHPLIFTLPLPYLVV